MRSVFLQICVASLLLVQLGAAASQDQKDQPQLRRPVGMVLTGNHLLVANHQSGTISVVDRSKGTVESEVKIGQTLSDLALLPDGQSLLALSDSPGQLIGLRFERGLIAPTFRLDIGSSPMTLMVSYDGKTCSITQKWAHWLTFVGLPSNQESQPRILCRLDLPFAPGKQWLSVDGKILVVADAFGGDLAIVDFPTRKLLSVRRFEGHEIGGMATMPDGKSILFSHLLMDPNVSTEHEHIFWGQVMGNVLRAVTVDELLKAPAPLQSAPVHHWALYVIGEANQGAGDMGSLAYFPDGRLIVALTGVNQVAIRRSETDGFFRVDVGTDPTAITLAPDGRTAYVANTMDDSISVVDVKRLEVKKTISLGPSPALTEAQRGEVLFHDAHLSLDGWYSCSSCHVGGHTCGLLNDNHTDGSFGTPKRVLSLLGAADTGPWAWNGSNSTLEKQVRLSMISTMDGKPAEATPATVNAIAAYLRTLQPAPGLDVARGTVNTSAVERGRYLFESLDCVHCHRPPTYTSSRTFDVGLQDVAGLTHFNPPSLRGVSQLPSFFHDNRATSLRDVLVKFKHPDGQAHLTDQELNDLLAFLRAI